MTRTWFALLLLVSVSAASAEKPGIDVQEFVLPNGMKWLLYENHASPTIAAGFVAHVGSANERPGITGLSHLFEHMMFKGTHVIGTKNFALDSQNIEAQEKLQDQMRAEISLMRERLRRGEIDDLTSRESFSKRYVELEASFDALVKKQRDNIVKEDLEKIYTRNGGERMNAFTTQDFTVYFVQVPANRLELYCWLESDRLMNRVFREFYSERDVVYEERRRSVEATPLGKYDEAFQSLFWEAHPYHWPVIGWPSDVAAITKAQADEYYAVHYAPNNLTGVLSGDFRAEEVRPLLGRYFGRIPRGKTAPPEVVTLEPPQLAQKRFVAYAETSPTLRILWHAVPFVHKDKAALSLVSSLLSGRTGRLYKSLVLSSKLANEVRASLSADKYAGSFEIEAVLKEGREPAAAEAAILDELKRLGEAPPGDAELQKVKNESKANSFRRLQSPFSIAIQLLIYDGSGDWTYLNHSSEETDAVSGEDVVRVTSRYLKPDARTVGVFLRKETPGVPKEILALGEPASSRLSQDLGPIRSETDPAKLRSRIKSMELASVPPEMKPAFEILLKAARERLAALESQGK